MTPRHQPFLGRTGLLAINSAFRRKLSITQTWCRLKHNYTAIWALRWLGTAPGANQPGSRYPDMEKAVEFYRDVIGPNLGFWYLPIRHRSNQHQDRPHVIPKVIAP
jgi:hypothetical protein